MSDESLVDAICENLPDDTYSEKEFRVWLHSELENYYMVMQEQWEDSRQPDEIPGYSEINHLAKHGPELVADMEGYTGVDNTCVYCHTPFRLHTGDCPFKLVEGLVDDVSFSWDA